MKFKYTDYHVHTRWSMDIMETGPSFEDYLQIAEGSRINVCFLEHYELRYLENDKSNPFYGENINNYLEELDELKETYDFVLCGLEVDYYEERDIQIREFMDDYGKQLDFVAGTIHEWIFNYPITTRERLLSLLEKVPMNRVIDDYFNCLEKLINSRIFKNVCHVDTIFRYINDNDIVPEKNCDVSEDRVLNACRPCLINGIRIEYNLSGQKFPIQRPFPSKSVALQLKEEGAQFFVGSDSHDLKYFEQTIPKVINAYELLNII
jgi:HisJ family histidinol phosphate phosphatase